MNTTTCAHPNVDVSNERTDDGHPSYATCPDCGWSSDTTMQTTTSAPTVPVTLITRRDVIKAGAGLVIGAGLAAGTVETGGAGQRSREAFERVLAWEDALAAADKQGAAWVGQVHILRAFLTAATDQAEQAGLPSVAASLRPQIAELDEIHQVREEAFAHWAFAAWALPDLGLIPPRPWP